MSLCLSTQTSERRLRLTPLKNKDILLVACVRNELLKLPWLISYYRGLGIDRFFFIDNDSNDGTKEYCDAQQDALVFCAKGSYSASKCGIAWTNEILDRFATGKWALVVDADELLVYPNCETRSLRQLTTLLEDFNANAFIAPMLDMYPEGTLWERRYVSGENFLHHSPLFDSGPYEFAVVNGMRTIARGGARKRLFWDGQDINHPPPYLFKVPFVKWRHGLAYTKSTHILKGVRLAPLSGLLQHFKFLDDFSSVASHEAQRGEHFEGARQYRAYAQRLAQEPNLRLGFHGSIKYDRSSQVVALGLMTDARSRTRLAVE